MFDTVEWYSGFDNYKKHTYCRDLKNKVHNYTIDILDVDIPNQDRPLFDIFADYLSQRQTKTVEVLYSGGMDSELILYSCISKNVPVRAVTMRILVDNVVVNIHDLYYSEKFCRKHNLEQLIIDFDAKNFFDNGQHLSYLDPYLINQFHVASHFWLLEQCTGFPVFSGEYTWPWTHVDPMIISPIKYHYSVYDKFLSDRNIHGIGSMLGYGLESNCKFIREHIKLMNSNSKLYGGDNSKIVFLKNALWKQLGYPNPELRLKNYGWESVKGYCDMNVDFLNTQLKNRYGITKSEITWQNKTAMLLHNTPGKNARFA